MTPKEKAKDLFNKFYLYIDIKNYENTRQCALIAVDEILKSNPTKINCYSTEFDYGYYQEVKKEINKL